jgi:hypothetical protein
VEWWLKAANDKSALHSVIFALFKYEPWFAVATHLVRNAPDGGGSEQAETVWSGSFERCALREV